MDHHNLAAAMSDTAGVLPMDTCGPMNGLHGDEHGNPTTNGIKKKGRGRPPKSAGAPKKISTTDGVKRGRGRPPKSITSSTTVSRKLPTPKIYKDESSANDDGNKKKRGRPPKNNTLNEQINGVSKPQIPSAPVVKHQEKENVGEPAKRKRGRPFGSSPKKSVGAATTTKDVSSGRKRGRPSGSTGVKKSAAKPKPMTTADGAARKRGRPKKSVGASVSTTQGNGLALTTASYMA